DVATSATVRVAVECHALAVATHSVATTHVAAATAVVVVGGDGDAVVATHRLTGWALTRASVAGGAIGTGVPTRATVVLTGHEVGTHHLAGAERLVGSTHASAAEADTHPADAGEPVVADVPTRAAVVEVVVEVDFTAV